MTNNCEKDLKHNCCLQRQREKSQIKTRNLKKPKKGKGIESILKIPEGAQSC